MARCEHNKWLGQLEGGRYDVCGKPATRMGKMPFSAKPTYRCEEHASELAYSMPLRSAAKSPRTPRNTQDV